MDKDLKVYKLKLLQHFKENCNKDEVLTVEVLYGMKKSAQDFFLKEGNSLVETNYLIYHIFEEWGLHSWKSSV